MSKKRKTMSLSEDNHEYLSNHDNASALVDRLVTNYREGGGSMRLVQECRAEEERAKLNALEKRAEIKRELLDELESSVDQKEMQKERKLSEAKESLKETPKDTSNPAIQKWASDLGMTPQELIDEL